MSQEIWNVGGITQSNLFLSIKQIDDQIVHSGFTFEMYDSYPGTLWNGGRPASTEPEYSYEDFVRAVEMLNRHGIGFNFTFSNLLLEEKHLDDERGNDLLARFDNGQNGAIIGSEVLARYIRTKYHRYRLINTLTHYHRDVDYYRWALDWYDFLVLPPSLNGETDMIEEIGPERLEILVNETCHRNCPFSREHYRKISEYNLALGRNRFIEAEVRHFCERHHSLRLWPMSAEELGETLVGNAIAPREVERFVELGVRWFKLSARTRIGSTHHDIFSDIRAFIFRRMPSSQVKDVAHLMTSIINLNPRQFQALN